MRPKNKVMPKIEKGIPIPLKNHGDGTLETLRNMDVGDSAFIANKRASNVFQGVGRLPNKIKITTRTLIEKGVRGVRVWRIE